MADNQAGIELLLSAPDVKPIMDQVIDDWKEINRQEALAAQLAKELNEELAKTKQRLKETAVENQNVKRALEDIQKAEKQRADQAAFDHEHNQKGIIATIKAYFAQKKEMQELEKQIDKTKKALNELNDRQVAISLTARRGNSAAIKEYNQNEKQITSLTNKLGGLSEKLNVTDAKIAGTTKKFGAAGRAMAALGASAGAMAAAVGAGIALVAAAGLAVIYSIGKTNEEVVEQTERINKNFAKVKAELANAFAPVAFIIGRFLEKASEKISEWVTNNRDKIFDFSTKVAKGIAYVVGYTVAFFPFISNAFKKMAKDIEISWQVLKLALNPAELFLGGLEKLRELEEEREKLSAETPINPIANAEKLAAKTDKLIKEMKDVFQTNTKLTKEQIEAIKKLRDEYDKLTKSIQDQINALNVQQAGPIAGILLKSEAAAIAIEKESARYVELAKKLGKSQEEIDKVTSSFNRLIDASRNDARRQVITELTASLKELDNQIQDNAARKSGTQAELQLERTLESLGQQRNEINKVADALRGLGSVYEINKAEYESIIRQTLEAIDILEKEAIESFNTNKAKGLADKRAKELEAELDLLKKYQKEIIDEISNTPNISDDRKELLQVIFETNLEKLEEIALELEQLQATASEEVIMPITADLTEAEKAYKEFADNLTFRIPDSFADTSDSSSGIDDKPDEITVGEALDAIVDLHQIAYSSITDIVLSSIDQQIEALDRLTEVRNNNVDELSSQLDREALLKANNLSNDYDLLKQQLADEVKLRDASERQALELAKKRAKIQRQIDTANQASAIISAISNIFAANTKANPFGVALAIANVAVMLTAFAASKAKANKLVSAYRGSTRMGETFGMMAPGEGMDDSPGIGRGLSVVDKNGQLRGFIGGDEYMHKQSVSKKHRKAFSYLNENESKFSNINLLEVLHSLENSAPVVPLAFPDFSNIPTIDYKRISKKNEKLRDNITIINKGLTKDDLESAVDKALKTQTQELINYLESRPDYVSAETMKDYFKINSKSVKQFKSR